MGRLYIYLHEWLICMVNVCLSGSGRSHNSTVGELREPSTFQAHLATLQNRNRKLVPTIWILQGHDAGRRPTVGSRPRLRLRSGHGSMGPTRGDGRDFFATDIRCIVVDCDRRKCKFTTCQCTSLHEGLCVLTCMSPLDSRIVSRSQSSLVTFSIVVD